MAMGNMEMREREISLPDLLVEILLHWRMIIVAILLGGLCWVDSVMRVLKISSR